MDWNAKYLETPGYFGDEPEPVLVDLVEALDRGLPVLDLGSGPGRNTFFLAREGFVVHAVDPSGVATRALERVAEKERLLIDVWTGSFSDYPATDGSYGTILALGLIPELDREGVDLLVAKMRAWLAPAGIAIVTAFTTADPSFARFAAEGTELGKSSFVLPEGEVRTFLEPDEAPALFGDLEVLRHSEGMDPEHRHGNGPEHRHAMVNIALRR